MKYITKFKGLTNIEILDYKIKMEKYRKALLEEAAAWTVAYIDVKDELRDRLEDLQIELLYAEEERMNEDWSQTSIN